MKGMKVKQKNKNAFFARFSIVKILGFLILSAYALFMIYMLVWAITNSLKGKIDYTLDPIGLYPKNYFDEGWCFSNYADALKMLSFTDRHGVDHNAFSMLFNTLVISLGATLAGLASRILVSYCCARYNFKLGAIIVTTVLVVMMIPVVGSLPSMLQLVKTLNIYDTYWGFMMMRFGFADSYFLVLYAAFKTIPKDYSDAAKIDGAGHWTIMLRIMIPLCSSVIFAIAVLQFVALWNSYSDQMIFLSSMPVINFGLYSIFVSGIVPAGYTQPKGLAAALIVLAPVLALFIIFRERLMTNISLGGLKG